MKRTALSVLLILGGVSISNADVYDFTGVDIQTESITVVDVSTRPTGFVYGLGAGRQNVGFPEINYKAPMINIDVTILCWQATPQFQWNILGYEFGIAEANIDDEKSNELRLDLYSKFTFFSSPKVDGSFIFSAWAGYSLSDGYIYEHDLHKSGFGGFTFGLGAGYTWKFVKLEADLDFYSTYTEINHDTYESFSPSLGFKATFFYLWPSGI